MRMVEICHVAVYPFGTDVVVSVKLIFKTVEHHLGGRSTRHLEVWATPCGSTRGMTRGACATHRVSRSYTIATTFLSHLSFEDEFN